MKLRATSTRALNRVLMFKMLMELFLLAHGFQVCSALVAPRKLLVRRGGASSLHVMLLTPGHRPPVQKFTTLRGGFDDSDVVRALSNERSSSSIAATNQSQDDDLTDSPSKPSSLALGFLLVSTIACFVAIRIVSKGSLIPFLTQREELLVVGILTFFTGYRLSVWLADYTIYEMMSLGSDTTVALFLQRAVKYFSLAIAVSCLLGSFGINISGLTAALTSFSVAIGFASQKVLSNLAAGIMLMIFRPYSVGDIVIVAGKTGIIAKTLLFETRLDTFSNVRISVPNSEIFGAVIENASRNKMRRIEIEIQTAASADVDKARKCLEQVVADYEYLARDYLKQESQKKFTNKRLYKMSNGSIVPQQVLGKIAPVSQNATKAGQERSFITTFDSSSMISNMVLKPSRTILERIDNIKESRISLTDYLSLANKEHDEGKTKLGMKVSLPQVVMKDLRSSGSVWECRVFVPTAQFDYFRCKLVEDIARSLVKYDIKTVARVMEDNAGVCLPTSPS
mmetsp:Transcript_17960/g.58994  ORF Transcript_17960/g.58994 Transcript_17960/m.58994 type:complete len:510 (-) Transcript_17960:157-1686(-)